MVSFFRASFVVLTLFYFGALGIHGQTTPKEGEAKPQPKPTPSKVDPANLTAEQIVESTIIVYAYPGGRPVLEQIRKTTYERGKTTVMNGEGRPESASYQKWIIRGPSLAKEKVRLYQEFPKGSYSLIQNEDKIFGIVNDQTFSPREDATLAFQNQIFRGLDGLLRYKENESTLELVGKEKVMGVEYHVVDVTDKQSRKTRYYISAKRFRVMMLEYTENSTKFRRKFYDYNYPQGTLVPFRTVLFDGDKVIEETEIGTVTFGQKVDDELFPSGS